MKGKTSDGLWVVMIALTVLFPWIIYDAVETDKYKATTLETRLVTIETDLAYLRDTVSRKPSESWEKYTFVATGYAPHDNKGGICNDGDPTSTATGTYPRHGTIAVNPEIIPYGSSIYVEGYGFGIAEDTGSIIRKNTHLIDLYFDTYEEAIAWGRRTVTIFVLAPTN